MDRVLAVELASFGADAYDRKLFADLLHICGRLFLVVVKAGRVCGYMVTCVHGRSCTDRAEVVSIAVEPGMRGRGAASALMKSTLRRLRRRKISRVSLMVRVSNDAARGFYERYGFRKLRQVPRYYHDGEDGVLMSRVLEKSLLAG
jgi:ribosomal-protein-alanine N-acetyltransferase